MELNSGLKAANDAYAKHAGLMKEAKEQAHAEPEAKDEKPAAKKTAAKKK